jgi:hypothetical protein
MANPLLRSNIPDLYLDDALPSIEYVIQEEYENHPIVGESIFNVREMSQGIAQTTQVSSLQPAGAVGEGETVPMQKIYQGYDKTYTAVKYGILLATSQESIDDERYEVLSKNPRRLARAFATTQETLAAQIFNEGFSTTGPDGKVLFASDHPLLAPGAGTCSNLLSAADLSATSLKDILSLSRAQLDSAGNRIQMKAKKLLVAPSNEFLAHELVKSIMLPASDNAYANSTNSVRDLYGIEVVVWDFLTDADAFFLLGDKMDHELNWYWRKRPMIGTDMEFKSEVALTKMTARMVCGYSDWRGTVGCAGTG